MAGTSAHCVRFHPGDSKQFPVEEEMDLLTEAREEHPAEVLEALAMLYSKSPHPWALLHPPARLHDILEPAVANAQSASRAIELIHQLGEDGQWGLRTLLAKPI